MDNTDSNFIFWQCLIRPINYPWAAPRRMVRAGSPWHQKLLMTIRAAHHPPDYWEYFVLNFYPDFWKVLTVDPSYFFFLLRRQGVLGSSSLIMYTQKQQSECYTEHPLCAGPGPGCGWYNDSILCWAPAAPDTLATLPCSSIPELASPCHPGNNMTLSIADKLLLP